MLKEAKLIMNAIINHQMLFLIHIMKMKKEHFQLVILFINYHCIIFD